MDVGFTRNDIAGDIAEALLAKQGDGYQNAIQYEIKGFAGHSLNASANWFAAKNLPGIYEWLTLVKLYGPAFANRSLARLGFKLVPLGGNEIDAKATKSDIDKAVLILTGRSDELGQDMDGAGKPKIEAVK